MRKKLFLVLALAFLLIPLFQGEAHALICEESQALNGPDECWTKVTLSSNEPTIVSAGHVLVWEIDALSPKQGAYQVQLPTTSLQNNIVAGVTQGPIVSGQSALILVRGFGNIRTVGAIASRDMLVVAASGNAAAINYTSFTSGVSQIVSGLPVAVALETSATNGTTARKAYIRVL